MALKKNERRRKVWKSNMFFVFNFWLLETSFLHLFQAGLEHMTFPNLVSDYNTPAPTLQVLMTQLSLETIWS